jgi:hypothetical protein
VTPLVALATKPAIDVCSRFGRAWTGGSSDSCDRFRFRSLACRGADGVCGDLARVSFMA